MNNVILEAEKGYYTDERNKNTCYLTPIFYYIILEVFFSSRRAYFREKQFMKNTPLMYVLKNKFQSIKAFD